MTGLAKPGLLAGALFAAAGLVVAVVRLAAAALLRPLPEPIAILSGSRG